jgi:mRNA interferase RelE/StbE
MSYRLEFLPSARKEWDKLGATLRDHLKKKLAERLLNPHVPGDALRGLADHYKIKLRTAGYRLVYRVEDEQVTVVVVAVGRRERSEVYKTGKKR